MVDQKDVKNVGVCQGKGLKQLNVGGRTGLDKVAVIVKDVRGIKGKPHTLDQDSRKDTSRAQPGGSRCKTKRVIK